MEDTFQAFLGLFPLNLPLRRYLNVFTMYSPETFPTMFKGYLKSIGTVLAYFIEKTISSASCQVWTEPKARWSHSQVGPPLKQARPFAKGGSTAPPRPPPFDKWSYVPQSYALYRFPLSVLRDSLWERRNKLHYF